MGSIVERPSGGFQAKVRVQGFPAQFKTLPTRQEAKRWIAEVETAMRSGSWREAPDAGLTLGEAIKDWIEANRHRIAGIDNEAGRLRRLSSWSIPLGRAGGQAIEGPITDLAISRVMPRHIETLAASMREAEYAGDSIRLYLALISRAWNRTMKDSQLRNPVEAAEIRLDLAGRDRRLHEGEEERLLAACPEMMRAVIGFALATAARQSEIAGLSWRDVDLKRRSAILRETKNGETRSLPLSRKVLEILEGLPRRIDGGSVFGMSAEAIKRAMIKATDKAGIDNLRFHDLRHEAISRLYEFTDLTDVEIASITGHKSMQMLRRYAHLRTHRLADRLDGAKRGFHTLFAKHTSERPRAD